MRATLGRLKRQGLTAVEIPFLLADIRQCLAAERRMPLESLNRELEALGWGLCLLDASVYKVFTASASEKSGGKHAGNQNRRP